MTNDEWGALYATYPSLKRTFAPMSKVNNPQVLERARQQIAYINENKDADFLHRHAEHMRVVGWLGALKAEELISESVHQHLTLDAMEAATAADKAAQE
ncbi:hypothetical protein FACS1894145_8230 [Bacteroidia bacterium]|nr:hypothetical protein FACS1894145_8230 [Bacteroidia bacterium]